MKPSELRMLIFRLTYGADPERYSNEMTEIEVVVQAADLPAAIEQGDLAVKIADRLAHLNDHRGTTAIRCGHWVCRRAVVSIDTLADSAVSGI
jgi:hypothetical protein